MSRRYLLSIFACIFLSGTLISQPKESMEIQFPALGNCYLCKLRIEAKLNLTEGVISSDWNYETKVTTVVYDEAVTDAFQVMHAVADTGHDTEWYPAPDSMYNLLVGTCCEYERTIDYTNVQIGYLSLMGIWVWPLGIRDTQAAYPISLYPSIGSGRVTIDVGALPFGEDPQLSIYSMKGQKVCHRELPMQSRSVIDLSSLAGGQYLAAVTLQGVIIHKSKLVINP